MAGDLSTGLAYIIPAEATFKQIERQLGCRIELKHDPTTAVASLDNQPRGYEEGQDLTDKSAIYTRSTIREGREYIAELANNLFAEVFPELPDYETMERVLHSLPTLLGGFALKLGGENPAPINREIMAFVYNKRL